MKLYCATTNPGKLREFRSAASGAIVIEPVPDLASIPACEETGITFEENAIQKAIHYGAHTDGYLFVDDSGLQVDALGGEPGVYSARYAGPLADDAANNALLLEKMRGVTNRAARFVCVIALSRAGKLVATFRGEVEGELLDGPRGPQGFGYDPLFWYPPFQAGFGEIPAERKFTVSHRGQALRKMLAHLGVKIPRGHSGFFSRL